MNDLTENRPWGAFRVLYENEGCKVKSIVVKPDSKLSLQSHSFRAEHWVVVKGIVVVTVGEVRKRYTPGEHVYIPVGEKHRLENTGECQVEVIEVQFGSYLGEDDITRYDDIYSRV